MCQRRSDDIDQQVSLDEPRLFFKYEVVAFVTILSARRSP
jgi:hypothetical protein